jgi:hypothetical protein
MPETTKPEADVTHADFMALMQQVNRGQSPHELSKMLEDAVAAVRRTGKSATITYTVSIAPAGKKAGDQVTITDKPNVKLPEEDRWSSIFFTTDKNSVQREDPRQQMMGDEGGSWRGNKAEE